jgi:hypothetical protein
MRTPKVDAEGPKVQLMLPEHQTKHKIFDILILDQTFTDISSTLPN